MKIQLGASLFLRSLPYLYAGWWKQKRGRRKRKKEKCVEMLFYNSSPVSKDDRDW